jgi:adenosylcobinamide kinase/adenosylcobinamide-phosphate guanylyltransferase
MRVFVGGAFNGKRAFVRELVFDKDVQWIECGEADELPNASFKTIVVAGLESFVESHLERPEEDVIEEIMSKLNTYRKQSDVLVIVTENGRGIVPIVPETRELRDRCGRLSQHIFKEATEVTRIWYGLPETLK